MYKIEIYKQQMNREQILGTRCVAAVRYTDRVWTAGLA